jgi:hypothetical protein
VGAPPRPAGDDQQLPLLSGGEDILGRPSGDVEAGQVASGHGGRLFEPRERLQHGVLVVPHDHVDDRQLVLGRGPEGLDRVLRRTVADEADHGSADAPLAIAECDADRRRDAHPLATEREAHLFTRRAENFLAELAD